MSYLEHRTALIFDLFFCVIFMPLLLVLGPSQYWITKWPLLFIIVSSYMYACYFVIKHMRFPALLLARKYRRIILLLVSLTTGTYLLTLYPLPDIDFVTPAMSQYQTHLRNYSISISIWMMYSLVTGYSLTVSFVKELYDQLLLKKRIENEMDKARLAMFKAQISPHFLFNTLNSLYSLVIGTSSKAENAFIKFTEILKYTYTAIDNEWVPLNNEVEYIQNYIDLQYIRLNLHTHVTWEHNIDNDTLMIPPMILLTFVENAFKYGASTSRDCKISIHLTVTNGLMEFITRNAVMKHADEFRTEMPVGLENCKARLAAIYPQKHRLDTYEDDGIFTVILNMDLNK